MNILLIQLDRKLEPARKRVIPASVSTWSSSENLGCLPDLPIDFVPTKQSSYKTATIPWRDPDALKCFWACNKTFLHTKRCRRRFWEARGAPWKSTFSSLQAWEQEKRHSKWQDWLQQCNTAPSRSTNRPKSGKRHCLELRLILLSSCHKLGMHVVRVLQESRPASESGRSVWLRSSFKLLLCSLGDCIN
jgi:hypothetical protein